VSTQPKNAALAILTATLGEAAEGFVYVVSCLRCRSSRRIDLERWRAELGESFPIAKLRHRHRCLECKSREVIVACMTAMQYEQIDRRPDAKHVLER
jgi:hypothetical protein